MDDQQTPAMPQAPEAALATDGVILPIPDQPGAIPTAAPKEEPVSQRFEALARREREIRRQAQEAKQREEALKERETKYQSFEEKKAKARLNPLEALQELGLTYEELTQYIINDQKPTADMEVKSVRDEIRKMREDQVRLQTEAKERQEKEIEQSRAQAVENYKADLADFLAEHAETYDLVANLGDQGVDLVYDTIQTDWQKKIEKYEANGRIGRPPKIMSTEEAVKLVEDYYEQEMDSYYSKSKKLQSKYARTEAAKPAGDVAEDPAPSPARTLNNGLISPSSPGLVSAQTDADRMARALKALE